jgi:hypothetical protein
VLPDFIEQRRLDPAKTKVELRRARSRKREGPGIALLCQAIDGRAAREGQSQNARPFVERFPRRVVAGATDHLDVAVGQPADQVAVSAGDHEPQHWRLQVRVLEQSREDVGGEMADPQHRQPARPGNRLPQVDTDQQAAD